MQLLASLQGSGVAFSKGTRPQPRSSERTVGAVFGPEKVILAPCSGSWRKSGDQKGLSRMLQNVAECCRMQPGTAPR